MNQIKIRILESSVLTPRWETNFCIEELQNRFEVEYWDCTKIVSPSFSPKTEISKPYVVKIKSLKDLNQRIKQLSLDTLLITNIHENPENFRFYKTIASRFKTIVTINFFADNSEELPQSRLMKLIRKFNPRHAREIFYWKLYRKMFQKILISCSPSTEPYRINHPDYESFIRVQGNTSDDMISLKPMIVYIDNYFPFHPEIKKREPSFQPEKVAHDFYQSLNRFFSLVEEKYHCQIVIAAHPSADFEKNPFNGRKIIFNKTDVLVKESMGVLMHTSNSLSYVYLNNVPVAFLTNAAYEEAKLESHRLKTLSEINHIRIVDTDQYKTINDDVLTPLDPELRTAYMKYQTDGNPETNAQRLTAYLTEIAQQIEKDHHHHSKS